MTMSVQIMRNILSNWGAFALGAIVQFMMMPFLVNRLGDTQYGIWILIMSFTGFLGLFDFGVGGSVVKYVAEFRAKKDEDELNRVCSSAFYIFVIMGIAAFLLSLVLAAGFVEKFNIPQEDLSSARWVTILTGLSIGIALPYGFFVGYMRGMQRYDLVAGISLAILFVRTAIIIVLVLMGYKLVAIAVMHLLSTLAAGTIRAFWVYKEHPGLKLRPSLIKRETLTMVGRYSFLLFLYYMANRLIFSVGNLTIGYYMTAAMVTLYAIPHRLVDELRMIIMSTGVFQPAISHLNAQGRDSHVQKVLVIGTKYSMMAVLPIAAAYFIVGDSFLALWVGQKYASAGHTVLIILTIAILANLSQYTSTQILQGIAKHGSIAYITIAEAAANLILSIFLVRKYGINGAAIGTLIPMLFSNLLFIPWYTCRELNFSLSRFYMQGLVIPCIPAFIFGLILFVVSRIIGIDSWMRFVLVIFSCSAVYACFAWYLCLTKPERLERWRDIIAAVNSGTAFMRDIVLFVRSRVEKPIP